MICYLFQLTSLSPNFSSLSDNFEKHIAMQHLKRKAKTIPTKTQINPII